MYGLYIPGSLIVIKGPFNVGGSEDFVIIEIWKGTILGRTLVARKRVPIGDLGDPETTLQAAQKLGEALAQKLDA